MSTINNIQMNNYANSSRYYLPANYSSQPVIRNYNYEEEPQDISKTTVAAGVLQAIALGLHKASEWCSQKLMQGKEFTSAENIEKVAGKMVNDNKLNVDVGFIGPSDVPSYAKKYGTGLAKELEVVASGQNAFYHDGLKLAVAPKSKPSLILHELGHAINARKGKFLRFLQKSRMFASAAPTALLMLDGIFHKRDDKPNFIERNAGILGFMSFLPTIIEEGLASIRGVKAAKGVLGKAVNLKALKRNYIFAWSTYLLAGIGLGVAAKQAFVQNRLERN